MYRFVLAYITHIPLYNWPTPNVLNFLRKQKQKNIYKFIHFNLIILQSNSSTQYDLDENALNVTFVNAQYLKTHTKFHTRFCNIPKIYIYFLKNTKHLKLSSSSINQMSKFIKFSSFIKYQSCIYYIWLASGTFSRSSCPSCFEQNKQGNCPSLIAIPQSLSTMQLCQLHIHFLAHWPPNSCPFTCIFHLLLCLFCRCSNCYIWF